MEITKDEIQRRRRAIVDVAIKGDTNRMDRKIDLLLDILESMWED
jgi:hypothetical protein